MKKLMIAIAALFVTVAAHAQFGVIAGLTSSKTDVASATQDVKNIALYHAGVTCKLNIGAGFAVQPSLLYQVKGAKLENVGDTSVEQLKSGYVEVPVSLQWGPDLVAFRPYGFVEPFVGYQISSSDKGISNFAEWSEQAKNKFEYGFGIGGGIEVAHHIQISAQWFKNLGNMFGDNAQSADAAWSEVKNFKNFQGIKVSLAILF